MSKQVSRGPLASISLMSGQESRGSGGEYQADEQAGVSPWVGKMPWSRKWQPTPVFLPGKFHGAEEPAGL